MAEQDQTRSFMEVNFQDTDLRVRALAQRFYETVVASGRFQWMGMGSVEDELKRPRLVIYFAERTVKEGVLSESPRPVSITPALTDLQMALNSEGILDTYHLIESEDSSSFAERALRAMQARYGKPGHDPKTEFLWEEHFPE